MQRNSKKFRDTDYETDMMINDVEMQIPYVASRDLVNPRQVLLR